MKKSPNDSCINNSDNKLVLYSDKHGDVELRAEVAKDTIWATQDQIARIFDTQRPAITKHITNIFRTRELSEDSVCSILERTGTDGKLYKVKFYNLDAIIAIGYRVNSKKATKFRIWATKILHEYLVKGFNVNERTISRSADNIKDLEKALAFMGSDDLSGVLKGKMVLRVSKELKK
ncbi:MAG: virulence RhuM family protein [Patescibacteria group bacterium]|nr:virulence RhuM family protein [Patescibacteria group bacterium]